MQTFTRDITSTLYANPHSRSTASVQTALAIDRVRSRVLSSLFGLTSGQAKSWDVVFTSGATASLKLVADAFPWQQTPRPCFRYLKQSHTRQVGGSNSNCNGTRHANSVCSLVGIRGVARAHRATVEPLDAEEFLNLSPPTGTLTLNAYPAQCNATGSRLGLAFSSEIKRMDPNAVVLCDAAAYLSTSVLDLGSCPTEDAPDFIACSFYKLFVSLEWFVLPPTTTSSPL